MPEASKGGLERNGLPTGREFLCLTVRSLLLPVRSGQEYHCPVFAGFIFFGLIIMKISTVQGAGRIRSWAISLIWIPTHILNWSEGLLFRNCLVYRRNFIRKRLRA
jgi:hypothetical protein